MFSLGFLFFFNFRSVEYLKRLSRISRHRLRLEHFILLDGSQRTYARTPKYREYRSFSVWVYEFFSLIIDDIVADICNVLESNICRFSSLFSSIDGRYDHLVLFRFYLRSIQAEMADLPMPLKRSSGTEERHACRPITSSMNTDLVYEMRVLFHLLLAFSSPETTNFFANKINNESKMLIFHLFLE